jgi:hypothetical protein
MEDVGIFYGRLVYFMDVWSILWPFWILAILYFSYLLVYFMVIWYIFPVSVYCTNKNLATQKTGPDLLLLQLTELSLYCVLRIIL